MDDIVIRSRYPRHSIPNRKRKKYTKETGNLAQTMMRQLLICILIMAIIGFMKNMNTPVTKFLTEKIKAGLSQNIELKEIYNAVGGFFTGLTEGKSPDNDSIDSDEKSLPSSSSHDESIEDQDGENAQSKGKTSDSATLSAEETDQGYTEDIETIYSINEKFTFISPVSGILSSPFGNRVRVLDNKAQFHEGVDIEAEHGADIKAVLDGEVIEAQNSPTYGYFIRLEHEDGLVTLYAHCSKLSVKKGHQVKQGDTIAKVGNTGASVGTHLHFEVIKDGVPLNPLNFIEVSES